MLKYAVFYKHGIPSLLYSLDPAFVYTANYALQYSRLKITEY